MPYSKKGQVGEVMKYSLIGLFSIIILVFGYKMVETVREKACQTEISKFIIDLSNIDKSLRFGQKEMQSYTAPCHVDRIYFFDLGKNTDPEEFKDIPVLRDSLLAGGGNNVFLIKDGEVKKSFYAGNVELMYPYNICFVPKFDKISFSAEGTGKSARIRSACSQPECTVIPVNISEDASRNIIREAIDFGCTSCPTDLDNEYGKIQLSRQNVDIFRRFLYCDGITDVQIIIKPKKGSKASDFRYYEFIPKDCISDLNNYLAERLGGGVEVRGDPLILWHFSSLGEEKKISYRLNSDLSDDCKHAIEGLGVAEHLTGEELNQQATGGQSKILKLKPMPDVELKGGRNSLSRNLWEYTDYDGQKKNLHYTIISQDSNLAECRIKSEGESSNEKILKCERKEGRQGASRVKIEASDGTSSQILELNIVVSDNIQSEED